MFKRFILGTVTTVGIGMFAALSSPAAYADELNTVSWGGITSKANRAAYWDPFEKASGIKVIDDTFDGEIGKIRAQVMSGDIQWDVAEPEFAEEAVGCLEGLYEPIDKSMLPMDELPGLHVTDCGVTSAVSGTVLVYDKTRYGDNGPRSWADFWDLEKFPGKRGLPKSIKSNLVFALLADGVAMDQVYDVLGTKEGQDRAFAKLDEIKDHVIWWSSGTEQVQSFVSGEYSMAGAWNGRTAEANEQGQNLGLAWEAGWVSGGNRWVILKGTPKLEQAMKFIAFATQAGPQADFMRNINYGSINRKAYEQIEKEIDPKRLQYLPGTKDHQPYDIPEDSAFWLEHIDTLTLRFNNWISQ